MRKARSPIAIKRMPLEKIGALHRISLEPPRGNVRSLRRLEGQSLGAGVCGSEAIQ
jgi:hypothetical protein